MRAPKEDEQRCGEPVESPDALNCPDARSCPLEAVGFACPEARRPGQDCLREAALTREHERDHDPTGRERVESAVRWNAVEAIAAGCRPCPAPDDFTARPGNTWTRYVAGGHMPPRPLREL